MSNSANLPAPYLGVDQLTPLAALKNPFCENLMNFNISDAGISLRNGDSLFAPIVTFTNPSLPLKLFQYNNDKLFLAVQDGTTGFFVFYNLETGAVAYAPGTIGQPYFFPVYFKQCLFAFTQSTGVKGYRFDGTTWTAIGYTGSGFAAFGTINVYSNRMYIPQDGEAAYWYTEIDAITGALTKIDLSGVVSEQCFLVGVVAVTIQGANNGAAGTYQAFVFSTGEILFYQGSYPDSSTWGLALRAKISQPISTDGSIISYQGDALILCDSGVVSLRDLFLGGSEAAQLLTVNLRIKSTWDALVAAFRVVTNTPTGPMYEEQIRGIVEDTGRIVISFNRYLDDAGVLQFGNFYFIFDSVRKGWYFQRSYGGASTSQYVFDIIRYKKLTLIPYKSFPANTNIATMGIFTKEGATNFTDRSSNNATNTPYDYEMCSAPIPFPKTAVYEATMIEPILESDLYAETNWNLIADFGRQTSGNQKTDAATTAVAKPAVNVGIQNITFVQVKMSGSTVASKTVGLDLYSYNVWYNSGEIGSR